MVEWIKPGINIDWVGKRKLYFWFSTSAVVVACLVMVVNFFVRGEPVNYGTDFKGGSQIQVEFNKDLSPAQVRSALQKANFKDVTVVKVTDPKRPYFFMLRVAEVTAFSPAEQDRVKGELQKAFGGQLVGLDYKTGSDKLYVRLRHVEPAAAAPPPAPAASQPASAPASQPAEAPASQAAASQPAASQPVAATSQPAAGGPAVGVLERERQNAQKIEDAFAAGKVEVQQVQRFGKPEDNIYEATLTGMDRDIRKVFDGALGADTVKDVPQIEAVGAKMGKQLRDAGIKSVIYSLLLIFLYVALRFDFRYGPGGVISLLHDVFIVTGLAAVTWTEFSMTAVAALLTLAGYSINDTIVVYDRIRENIVRYRDRSLSQVINASINETLSRTILTSFATFLTSAAMWVLGTGEVKVFSFLFSFGIIIGTYSSVAVAAPLTLWINDKIGKRSLAARS